MAPLLTFIVPLRHPENLRNVDQFLHTFGATLRSLSAQSGEDWRILVVANAETPLPTLPPRTRLVSVDLPANRHHDRDGTDPALFRAAVRKDKGRRLAAGVAVARGSRFVMFVDDDDLVHRSLSDFVRAHADEEGWFVENGYQFEETRRGLRFLPLDEFWRTCGTCHVVRPDRLPIGDGEPGSDSSVPRLLGGHLDLIGHLAARDQHLSPLPFRAAAYRRGHLNSHSSGASCRGLLRRHVLNKGIMQRPLTHLRNLRLLVEDSTERKAEFLGGGAFEAPVARVQT